MAIMAPPQHGKSWTAEDFIGWCAGKHPEWKTIFASYSDDLGIRCNTSLQRTLGSERYQALFPHMRIGQGGWICNTALIEYPNHSGSFRNTTVNGAINGMELHLGVIDDPHKSRAEALSKVTRDRVWDWFTDDWSARFSANSALLIIMTRWHVDDVLGRLIERHGDITLVRYPAIAEQDEKFRNKGTPLFPTLKPLSFLEERRKLMSIASWESEYQQNPVIVGGGIYPIDKIQAIALWGNRDDISKSVRYWDKAGTEDGGAYTAGVLMHKLKDGRFVIEHVTRGQWSALEREQHIKAWAERDKALNAKTYEVIVEQEPGSGGKESAEHTIRMLSGFRVYADKVTGSKEVRAEPFAAQVQGGNVYVVAGPWNYALLDELESFPNGRFRDQADACAGAFNRLTNKPAYHLDALAS
jgi:predicted phage terminase large subunit-like protein